MPVLNQYYTEYYVVLQVLHRVLCCITGITQSITLYYRYYTEYYVGHQTVANPAAACPFEYLVPCPGSTIDDLRITAGGFQ